MKKIINILLSVLLFISFGCSDEFLNINNENELAAETFFTNLSNLELALNGIYSSINSAELYGMDYPAKVAPMLAHTSDQDWLGTAAWNQLGTNEVTSDNSIVHNTWRGLYRVVTRANDFLENAQVYQEENMISSEVERVNQMLGEAYFLRAWAYFTLVRLWGESTPAVDGTKLAVPLITTVPKTLNDVNVPRASVNSIYEQIIEDLLKAEDMLPDEWDDNDAARVDAYAAKGYLGKVYLYKEDYTKAKNYFTEIVSNDELALVPFDEYDGLFHGETEFSEESIWELNFRIDFENASGFGGLGTRLALITAPKGTGWSNVWPHDENIKRFGSDPRLRINALEPGVDTVTNSKGEQIVLEAFTGDENTLGWSYKKYIPQDFSVFTTNVGYGANYHMMRLADVYLMYAETLNALGEDNTALEYVNKVRRRAYNSDPDIANAIVDYTGLTGTQLRDSIREERFRELFNEGHRWFDIVRWGIADEECSRYVKTNAGTINFDDPIDNYLPIPIKELENNSAMTSSTGY